MGKDGESGAEYQGGSKGEMRARRGEGRRYNVGAGALRSRESASESRRSSTRYILFACLRIHRFIETLIGTSLYMSKMVYI